MLMMEMQPSSQACFRKRKMADLTKNETEQEPDGNNAEKTLLYALDDSPPWILALLLGLQVCSVIISIHHYL